MVVQLALLFVAVMGIILLFFTMLALDKVAKGLQRLSKAQEVANKLEAKRQNLPDPSMFDPYR